MKNYKTHTQKTTLVIIWIFWVAFFVEDFFSPEGKIEPISVKSLIFPSLNFPKPKLSHHIFRHFFLVILFPGNFSGLGELGFTIRKRSIVNSALSSGNSGTLVCRPFGNCDFLPGKWPFFPKNLFVSTGAWKHSRHKCANRGIADKGTPRPI